MEIQMANAIAMARDADAQSVIPDGAGISHLKLALSNKTGFRLIDGVGASAYLAGGFSKKHPLSPGWAPMRHPLSWRA